MSLNGLKDIGQEYRVKFYPKSGGIGSHRQFSLIMPPNYHELSRTITNYLQFSSNTYEHFADNRRHAALCRRQSCEIRLSSETGDVISNMNTYHMYLQPQRKLLGLVTGRIFILLGLKKWHISMLVETLLHFLRDSFKAFLRRFHVENLIITFFSKVMKVLNNFIIVAICLWALIKRNHVFEITSWPFYNNFPRSDMLSLEVICMNSINICEIVQAVVRHQHDTEWNR